MRDPQKMVYNSVISNDFACWRGQFTVQSIFPHSR